MDAQLERALRDLELSTEDLLEADVKSFSGVCNALARRANAITKLAFLMEQNRGRNVATIERLSTVKARGDQAVRRALDIKQDATAEWARLQQILRGYGVGNGSTVKTDVNL